MSFLDDPPVHQFPDRAYRRLLEDRRNLAEAVRRAHPQLARRLDFTQAEPVGKEFILEDWRRRECDLLFRVPFLVEAENRWVLILLLVEQQSVPDPAMPLRMLLYTVLYWETEWRAWEERKGSKPALTLTPVFPVVFSTGSGRWESQRTLADLVPAPPELADLQPTFQPLFWELARETVQDLLADPSAWSQTMAIVRAGRGTLEELRGIFETGANRLLDLPDEQRVRRHDLLWFVVSWMRQYRPRADVEQLVKDLQEHQMEATRRQEVTQVAAGTAKTWAEEAREEALVQARKDVQAEMTAQLRAEAAAQVTAQMRAEMTAQMRAEAAAQVTAQMRAEAAAQVAEQVTLAARRGDLLMYLQERFGPLPVELVSAVEAETDQDRLQAGIRRAVRATTLAEWRAGS